MKKCFKLLLIFFFLLCSLIFKLPVFHNSRTHINNVQMKINENEKEIAIKYQQIEDENNNIKNLKNDIHKNYQFLEDTHRLIESKQAQLKVTL